MEICALLRAAPTIAQVVMGFAKLFRSATTAKVISCCFAVGFVFKLQ